MKRIEISGAFGGNYVIAELDGEPHFDEAASDAELRTYVGNRGVNDSEITQAMEVLKRPPRKITMQVPR